MTRRSLSQRDVDEIGALDPEAVLRVREEAWPAPESMEDVHDALLWMGFVTDAEGDDWREWLVQLAGQRRVAHREGRWFAVDGTREMKKIVLGRLEKFFSERCLLSQPWVHDDKQTVTQVLAAASKAAGGTLSIGRFALFQVGV